MIDADTSTDTSVTPAPAAGDLQIPKYRLDEVTAKLNRVQEELAMKDRLYMQREQQMLAQQQPREKEPTPEELGLDPQTAKAVAMLIERQVSRERQVFEQQIGFLSNRTEKAELLAKRGGDKARYLSDIQKMQLEHNAQTGGFIPAETCLELIQSKEKDAKIRALEAQLAGKPVPEPQDTVYQQRSVPDASSTRDVPTGGAPKTAKKSFGELSVEEMEANLQEHFKGGNVL